MAEDTEKVETSYTADGSIKWCIAQKREEANYPSQDEWIFKTWYIHTVKQYSVIEKN